MLFYIEDIFLNQKLTLWLFQIIQLIHFEHYYIFHIVLDFHDFIFELSQGFHYHQNIHNNHIVFLLLDLYNHLNKVDIHMVLVINDILFHPKIIYLLNNYNKTIFRINKHSSCVFISYMIL